MKLSRSIRKIVINVCIYVTIIYEQKIISQPDESSQMTTYLNDELCTRSYVRIFKSHISY